MFEIEDELHAEPHGQFPTIEGAIEELRRRATLPWNEEPNRAPCQNWQECGRNYEIVEYEERGGSQIEIRRSSAFEISAAGIQWHSVG